MNFFSGGYAKRFEFIFTSVLEKRGGETLLNVCMYSNLYEKFSVINSTIKIVGWFWVNGILFICVFSQKCAHIVA